MSALCPQSSSVQWSAACWLSTAPLLRVSHSDPAQCRFFSLFVVVWRLYFAHCNIGPNHQPCHRSPWILSLHPSTRPIGNRTFGHHPSFWNLAPNFLLILHRSLFYRGGRPGSHLIAARLTRWHRHHPHYSLSKVNSSASLLNHLSGENLSDSPWCLCGNVAAHNHHFLASAPTVSTECPHFYEESWMW